MATARFLVESIANDLVWLEGREARHARGARRLGVGDEVVVFDGTGGEARGRITELGESRIAVSIVERRIPSRSGAGLTMFVAMPKGDRADWLVEKAAELGATRLVPLKTARGVVVPSATRIERWGRKCVEAAKQSGATIPMRIEAALGADAISGRVGEFARMLVGERGGDAVRMADLMGELTKGETAVIVGPEGGLTSEELGVLSRATVRAVRLGDSTLRIETAAIAFAAAWAMATAR